MKNNFLNENMVYSTESGRLCPGCQMAVDKCKCKSVSNTPAKGDGIIRITRQTKGRKGKGVSIVTGLPLGMDELKKLASQLKAKCGTGGTIKDGNIEIQGDNRDKIKAELEKQGYKVKLAGG